MADHLKVFHLKTAGDTNLPIPKGFWHMATCLRSIVISDQAKRPAALKEHELMEGEEAYEFLLRIICGLDSPLLGETEVLGQFKDFFKRHEQDFSGPLRETLSGLNRDAKKIRAKYLQNLGCTSYGSLLRKKMKGQRVPLTLVGAGSLAQDILPWFAKSENSVHLFTRTPQKYQNLQEQHNVELFGYDNLKNIQTGGILVIAAPVEALWVEKNFDLSAFVHIYDLRGESKKDSLSGTHVTGLHCLFESIEKNRRQAESIKERAISAIKEQANHLKLVERPRPFGWDDLWTYS